MAELKQLLFEKATLIGELNKSRTKAPLIAALAEHRASGKPDGFVDYRMQDVIVSTAERNRAEGKPPPELGEGWPCWSSGYAPTGTGSTGLRLRNPGLLLFRQVALLPESEERLVLEVVRRAVHRLADL